MSDCAASKRVALQPSAWRESGRHCKFRCVTQPPPISCVCTTHFPSCATPIAWRMLATHSLQLIAPLEFIRVTFIPRGTEAWLEGRVGVRRSFETWGWIFLPPNLLVTSFVCDGFHWPTLGAWCFPQNGFFCESDLCVWCMCLFPVGFGNEI